MFFQRFYTWQKAKIVYAYMIIVKNILIYIQMYKNI